MNEYLGPKSMSVYDIGQFHQYVAPRTGHEFAIAERPYATVDKSPRFIVLHQMGEFTVMERAGLYPNYHFIGGNQNFTLQLAPRYDTTNTAIERYAGQTWERLVWMRESGRIETLGGRWPGKSWDTLEADISPEYADALFEHHTIGERHYDFPYLKQNRNPFQGDLELLQQGE